jgi:hypothetical protein
VASLLLFGEGKVFAMLADLVTVALLTIVAPLVALVVFRNFAKTKRRSRRPVQSFAKALGGRTR